MPDRVEDVSIRINGQRWHAWSRVEIQRSLDSFATVFLEAPFEPERERFRATFRPFSFAPTSLYVGDELLFTGRLIDVAPSLDPDSKTIQATAYSAPAVLEDCTPPASAFPLEFNGLKIKRIAETLAEPFGLRVDFAGDEGAAFRRVAIRPDEVVHGFLVGLAQQRGLLISDTPDGALRLLRADSGAPPRVSLREGEPPLTAVSPAFSPRAYFSEITGLARTRAGRSGAKYTEQNPKLRAPLRPHTFTLGDTDDADTPTATKAKLGRMFGNMVFVTVEVPTWRDPSGALWEPNTALELEAPGAMLYRPTRFLIRNVTLRQEANTDAATLELVLPGSFSGEVPAELPWD